MGYTSLRGGLDAIAAAEALTARPPTDADEAALERRQVRHQLGLAVDLVMGEAGLYAPDLAAAALQQAEGDLHEAAFLLRAFATTLPRFAYGLPARGDAMRVVRRISSAFRDIPGGQVLGRTRDYTQRLLDLTPRTIPPPAATAPAAVDGGHYPKVVDTLRAQGLLQPAPRVNGTAHEPFDLTRSAIRLPATRATWLQALARGEAGAMVALAYSRMRGFGAPADHETIAELRVGDLPVSVEHPLTGKPVEIGTIRVTEVDLVAVRHARADGAAASAGLSYGLVFGQHERKAIAMALLDAALQEGNASGPASDQEFVLSHIDSIESVGFVEHLKLPHEVTFSALLNIDAQPGVEDSVELRVSR